MAIRADTIQYGPWTDGVSYSNAPEDIGPAGMADMLNMRVGGSGECATRNGYASYQSASALSGTPTITMAAEYKPDASTTHVVIVAGSAIYKYDSGWSAITGSVSVTAGDTNTFEWANCNGTLVATNGVNPIFKWTGSSNAAALGVDSRFTSAAHIAWFDNRLWAANTNSNSSQLWYSDIGDIETWSATSYYNLSAEITALVPAQNALVVHTRDGISSFVATGNTSIPYSQQRQTVEGAVGARSTVALPNQTQMFIGDDGIYEWRGGSTVQKVSYQLDDFYWPNLTTASLKDAFSVRYPAANEVWFFLPYANTKPNHVMVYNLKHGCWSGPLEYSAGRACATIINEKLHAGGYDGVLWDMDTGTNDNGTAINWRMKTGSPAPMGSDVRLRWLFARTYFDGAADYSTSVTQESSGLSGTTSALSLKSAAFVLGTDKLDRGKLATARMIGRDSTLAGYDPHSSLEYTGSGLNQPMTIRRVHLQFKTLGRKRRRARSD